MKQQSNFSSGEEHNAAEQQNQQPTAREFASVEEMLRHDAANIPVPPRIAERLQQSARDLPQPKTAWWKRVFGGTRS